MINVLQAGDTMGKLETLVISTLEKSEHGLSLAEIAERIGETEKKTFKILRKLFETGKITTGNRRYSIDKKYDK